MPRFLERMTEIMSATDFGRLRLLNSSRIRCVYLGNLPP